MTKMTEPSFDQISQKLDTLQRSYDDELSQQQTRISAQDRRIAAQDERIAVQDREIASLRHDRSAQSTVRPTRREVVDSPEAVRSDGSDRRLFLKGAVAAAAGAGLLLVGRPETAAAADGGNMIIGQANTATNSTSLTASSGAGLISTGSNNKEGLQGLCTGTFGLGVYGSSTTGYGISGSTSTGYSLFATGTNARIGILNSTYPAAPTAGTFSTGDIIKDTSSHLWLCTVAGTPGTWRRVGGPGSAGQLSLLPTVQRRVNTLDGTGIAVGTMATNTSRTTTDIATALGFATNEITGVMASVTAYPPGAAGTFPTSGYLGVAGNYTATPSLTVTAGQSFMTGLVLSSLVTGTLTIAAFATPVDITIDIIGYYR